MNVKKSRMGMSLRHAFGWRNRKPSHKLDLRTLIQTHTYTKWVNMKLQESGDDGEPVLAGALSSALRSGVTLAKILKVCATSGGTLPLPNHTGFTNKSCRRKKKKNPLNFNGHPKGKFQEIANLNMAFDFMNSEGIKLVNVGAVDVWDGEDRLVLGLLWTLIYNYQVANLALGFDFKALGAKAALLMWIQSKIPEKNVTDFTSDWRDGSCLSALVNAVGKEIGVGEVCTSTGSIEAALDAAEANLSITKLLSSEEMASPNCDEKSMMTYLSLYPNAKKYRHQAAALTMEANRSGTAVQKKAAAAAAAATLSSYEAAAAAATKAQAVATAVEDATAHVRNEAAASMAPNKGSVDTEVTITGTGLRSGGTEVQTVQLAGVDARVVSESDTAVVVVAAKGTPTTGDAILVNDDYATFCIADAWTYVGKLDAADLVQVNTLFDLMDTDASESLTKAELVEFLGEHRPANVEVAAIMYKILGFCRLEKISRDVFVAAFTDRKLEVADFDVDAVARKIAVAAEAAAATTAAELEAVTAAEAAAATGSGKRSADWRIYEGADLGGRQQIRVYFSTKTVSGVIRKNNKDMQRMLVRKGVHLRPDFEAWIPIDTGMAQATQDAIFDKAGTRISPFFFVDDEYVGGYERLVELEELGALDAVLAY